ncbi:carbonic anhydrase [Parasulfitobacter algicola]|uniref:Carbonic anhydrase n=1 Tax=Parasulfitobacter algicola TaxID=2614809 RepID=A0ABX2IYZ8_9RHOB|nr:carbonic anhydrase family protein [Sulfitobacter algicola]NSX55896.1 carbonic anhydrase family protein [Sulfitobacter algicola]
MKISLHFLVFGLFVSTVPAIATSWSYEGDTGPDKWGHIHEDFNVCADGRQQSPIDLHSAVSTDLGEITLNWTPADWIVKDKGYTLQLETDNAGGIQIAGVDYSLVQFHFHTPSEHAIEGERFPMEVHFVHQAENGNLAVIGVMMTGGGEAGVFDTILQRSLEKDSPIQMDATDASSLLPADTSHWRYQGSLTTPPCSEIVLWSVMEKPVAVSDAALAAYQDRFPETARPLQDHNRRFILTQ